MKGQYLKESLQREAIFLESIKDRQNIVRPLNDEASGLKCLFENNVNSLDSLMLQRAQMIAKYDHLIAEKQFEIDVITDKMEKSRFYFVHLMRRILAEVTGSTS